MRLSDPAYAKNLSDDDLRMVLAGESLARIVREHQVDCQLTDAQVAEQLLLLLEWYSPQPMAPRYSALDHSEWIEQLAEEGTP